MRASMDACKVFGHLKALVAVSLGNTERWYTVMSITSCTLYGFTPDFSTALYVGPSPELFYLFETR